MSCVRIADYVLSTYTDRERLTLEATTACGFSYGAADTDVRAAGVTATFSSKVVFPDTLPPVCLHCAILWIQSMLLCCAEKQNIRIGDAKCAYQRSPSSPSSVVTHRTHSFHRRFGCLSHV